ncbi:MAG: hypothetical protein J0M12_17705 [Deltaproteobacteria bacterium]|nr:hypothetical protein [Deltaproteobacteria bacterium]
MSAHSLGQRTPLSAENSYAAGKANPKQKDRDRDFVSDWDEINVFRTNPRRKDTNRNGTIDGFEYSRKKHRLMKDQRESFDKDPDNDGLTNEEEAYWGTDPKNPDTDGDEVVDGNDDADLNGIANEDEDDRPGAAPAREDLDDNGGVLPTATPKPKSTSTPTPAATSGSGPTPTPTPGSCFDELGRTHCFGIPNGLTGTISSGAFAWANLCSGCHGSDGRPPKSFQEISTALSTVSAMLGLSVSSQQRADITAFRNRP